MYRYRRLLLISALGLLLIALLGQADAEGEAAGKADLPAAATNNAEDQPSAEEVLSDLLKRRAENPLIEPAQPQTTDNAQQAATAPSPARTIGSAPNLPAGKLKREGSFVITRRGRMMRANGQHAQWLFVFESDKDQLADPPMYLMPCRMLEDMENLAARHNQSIQFILSGQVFTYRRANYLLPTMMKIAPRRGNLQQ